MKLSVMLPFRLSSKLGELDRSSGGGLFVWQTGVLLFAALVVSVTTAQAQALASQASVFSLLLKWTPLLAQGFLFNLAISFMAMLVGTAAGVMLGLARVSLLAPVRGTSWVVVQFFRNAPWLVLLFFVMFLMPFEFKIGGHTIPWQIILPQCVKRMLPSWMNWYAILTMATTLASIVGVSEVMTTVGRITAAESRTDFLIPIYSYVLLWFFLYCYPIARYTRRLEARFAER